MAWIFGEESLTCRRGNSTLGVGELIQTLFNYQSDLLLEKEKKKKGFQLVVYKPPRKVCDVKFSILPVDRHKTQSLLCWLSWRMNRSIWLNGSECHFHTEMHQTIFMSPLWLNGGKMCLLVRGTDPLPVASSNLTLPAGVEPTGYPRLRSAGLRDVLVPKHQCA